MIKLSEHTANLLDERQTTHGLFAHTAAVAQTIKSAFEAHGYHGKLSCEQCEAVDMIATKLARIVSGDHNEKDHWNDIAGYARLGLAACSTGKDLP